MNAFVYHDQRGRHEQSNEKDENASGGGGLSSSYKFILPSLLGHVAVIAIRWWCASILIPDHNECESDIGRIAFARSPKLENQCVNYGRGTGRVKKVFMMSRTVCSSNFYSISCFYPPPVPAGTSSLATTRSDYLPYGTYLVLVRVFEWMNLLNQSIQTPIPIGLVIPLFLLGPTV